MKLLKAVAFVLAAVVTGVLATKPIVIAMMDRIAVRNGPWRTSVGTGRTDANIYESAAVAVAGLYALAREETIYFTAFTDSAGAALEGSCTYHLTGRAPASRWWSLTMYGADNYLVPNAAGIYSRHASNLQLEADQSFVVNIASTMQPKNWLPSPAKGSFSITLRLYNPEAAVVQNLSGVDLPSIVRESCL